MLQNDNLGQVITAEILSELPREEEQVPVFGAGTCSERGSILEANLLAA
jgi:hypothetical protein